MSEKVCHDHEKWSQLFKHKFVAFKTGLKIFNVLELVKGPKFKCNKFMSDIV